MALNDESEELIKAKHKEICLNLNMDNLTGENAWRMYLDIKNNYTLDVSFIFAFFKRKFIKF